MPNKIMAAAPHPTPGAILIGDAFNMRHGITGGGMTVALSDVPMSSTINTLANVVQKAFSASSDPAMDNIQQTFFGYLRLGGFFSYGISAIFAGLCPHPLSLAFHFFAITIYGVGRLLLPFPSPKRLWDAAKLLWVASSILLPFIHSEGVRQTFFPLTVPAYYRTPPGNKGEKVREETACIN
ncbi:hypothetical protein GOBAR_AA06473 [Gossypium barbadense]|uniref:Squalene monooxygenase n=1 Tax=Gossypium barbadense TaxID=3634 RepID=A0A2P5YEV7_GOSBA|nr:hypothetical protein GOBAR_AA06473 [Gossypium barbadense]